MAVSQMQQRYINFTNSLFQEGFVDEQFTQLQQLQDESNPDFVAEVVFFCSLRILINYWLTCQRLSIRNQLISRELMAVCTNSRVAAQV